MHAVEHLLEDCEYFHPKHKGQFLKGLLSRGGCHNYVSVGVCTVHSTYVESGESKGSYERAWD